MLASTLRGAVSPAARPARRRRRAASPSCEVMVVTGRVQDLILNPEETGRITEVIAEGDYYGMQTFDQALLGTSTAGSVSEEVAMRGRLEPARLQADARRAGPARERHRAGGGRRGDRSRGRMRDAINNNPIVQICLVAVLLVVARSSSGAAADAQEGSGSLGRGGYDQLARRSSRPRRARSTSRQRSRSAERSRGERTRHGAPATDVAPSDRNRRPEHAGPRPGPPPARRDGVASRRHDRAADRARGRGGRSACSAVGGGSLRPGHGGLRHPRQGDRPLLPDHPGSRREPGAGPGGRAPSPAERLCAAGAAQLRLPRTHRRSSRPSTTRSTPARTTCRTARGERVPMRELPDYLRPLPGPNEGSAASDGHGPGIPSRRTPARPG